MTMPKLDAYSAERVFVFTLLVAALWIARRRRFSLPVQKDVTPLGGVECSQNGHQNGRRLSGKWNWAQQPLGAHGQTGVELAAFDSSGSDQSSYPRDEEDMEAHVGDRRRSEREAGHQSAPTSEGLSFTTNYHLLRYKVVLPDKTGQGYPANCSFLSCSVDNFN